METNSLLICRNENGASFVAKNGVFTIVLQESGLFRVDLSKRNEKGFKCTSFIISKEEAEIIKDSINYSLGLL